MLQALYSRSAASVTDHLKKLEEVGSSKFMSQYYLGYGHASIGDCGNETMYFEGISMLAAKAIEDNPLFVGQECSSRYIDFGTSVFYNPGVEVGDALEIIELYVAYKDFYTSSLEPLKDSLRARFPIKEGDKIAIYEKAIAARAFDILRGFLPASATTNVAWTARLSNAHEHLVWMMHHPLDEVKKLGAQAYKQLHAKYPNSFKLDYAVIGNTSDVETHTHGLKNIEGEEVFDFASEIDNFYLPFAIKKGSTKIADHSALKVFAGIEEDFGALAKLRPVFQNRPKRTKLHKHSLAAHCRMFVNGLIDFGSFRDLQRHRNGYCGMPILMDDYGLHPWYYENLTEELRKNAYVLLNKIHDTYKKFVTDPQNLDQRVQYQYLLPMGNLVLLNLDYSIHQAVYVAELRSGKTVHATLRPVAQAIGEKLEEAGVTVYYDKDESDWTMKRGEQDIIAKA
jgi:thymidylate synthase ThyX